MSRLQALGLVALVAALGCGGEEIFLIPDEPLDGAWLFDGVFSNLETDVRCRLSAEATLTQGAGTTVTGSGEMSLECDVDGQTETLEQTGAVLGGRLSEGALSFSLGLCAFDGRFLGAELEGAAGCVFDVESPDFETVGTVGHWRAFRADTDGIAP